MSGNKTAKNIAIYSIMAIFQKGISFFLVPLYTVLLSPSEFGLVNQVIAITSFFILLFNFALDEAAVRLYFPLRNFPSKRKAVLGTIVLSNILICVLGGILLFLFKDFVFSKFITEISLPIITLGVIIVVSSPLFIIYQKLLRIQEKARRYSFLSLLFALLQIALSVVFIVILDFQSFGYLLAIAIVNIIFFVISLAKLKDEILWKIDTGIVKSALGYGIKIVPHTLAGWFSKGFTILAIGNMLGNSLVGIFNAMNFLSIIINVMSKAVMDAFQPWIYKKLEDPEVNTKFLFNVSKLMGFSVVLVGFFLSLFSIEIVEIFIDSAYHSGFYLIPLLLFSAIIIFIGSLLVYVLYFYQNKTHLIGLASVIGAVLNVILCLWLIPIFNLLGAAIAIAIANAITAFIKQYYASKALNTKDYLLELYFLSILNLALAYLLIETHFAVKILCFLIEVLLIYWMNRRLFSNLIFKNKILNERIN